jgi:hypothetical protein
VRPSRIKSWVFRLFAIGLGFSVALIAAEIGLRLVGWPSPGLYVGGRGPIEIRAPGRNGGAYPPGVRGELRHYDYSVEWNVNSLGFRDAEVGPKRNGEWRIAFLGDSFTTGVGVRQQDRFADVFGSAIRQSRPNVTVWNISAPLCGTACEAEMLNAADQRYQIDELVLAFYGGNDLEDNHSWFVNASKPASSEHLIPRSSKEWLRDHSRLASFVWITSIRAWSTFRPPGIFNQPDLDRFWPDTERAFQLLRNAAGARRLTILYLPSLPEWDDSVWQVMRSRYGVADDARHLVRNAVAQWSRREGISFLDATDWIHQCVPDADCVFPVDTHWRAPAHRLVAQGLLRSSRWTMSPQ